VPTALATTSEGTLRVCSATPSVDFSYAFQPIVDTAARKIVSYEALIRGVNGEAARQVLSRVAPQNIHAFDADSRVVAIMRASKLAVACSLNLNFLPLGLFLTQGSIETTLDAARKAGIDPSRIVIEVTEGEVIDDPVRFVRKLNTYRGSGLKVAIDDFGAGYSGLNLLAEFQPDQIKVDMALVRGIERHGPRQAIVRAIIGCCVDLGIDIIAEGVETAEERSWFESEGVNLFQGYLFAAPGFETLPGVSFFD
jgi:blue light- and temperature-responsive anti-repressor